MEQKQELNIIAASKMGWEGMVFPLPRGKMIDWDTRSSFFSEVKMPFPLEMKDFII